ncbi:MAG: phenylacetate--CoA ligase [Candidatus Auribacterota bacterium]|nr:phenylacetate--CoA ligase [Candidatus Auribacterota bacterium]
MFWDKPLETIDCRSLQILQLDRINTALERIAATPGYKSFYDSKKYKIKPLSSLEQMKDLPFTTKQDLRNSYPSGFLVTDMEKVVRMHSSSGTTGIPTVIYHTKNDIDNWSSLIARCLCMIGMSDKDVFQNMMTYGMFTGGLGLHYGAEKLGAMVIPAGAGNTERQLKFIKDFKTTVVHITPSYALHVSEIIEQRNLLDGLSLRIALMGAEPYTEATRLKLEERLRIDVINSYGLSEMNGPGVAFECLEKEGMHVWEDNYYVEIVDTKTGMPLPDGEEGELVLSAINREAMPILRYRTHDLAFIYPERCACGRTHRKISRIKGRTDDMFIIGGVNIFPSQIEEVLMKLPQVGSNYVIILSKKGSLDKLSVRIEVNPDLFAGDLRHLTQLKETITRKLREEILINPTIELVEPGSLPPSQGKAVRVIDNRDKTL